MPSFNIPPIETRRWDGISLGNYLGTLHRTFNVDLDRSEGKICLSRRMVRVADTSDTNTDTLGIIRAFLRSNASGSDRWWALSDTGAGNLKRLFYTIGDSLADPTSDWSNDTIASSPTNCRDFTVFENDTRGDSISKNQLFVTTDCDIAVLNDTGNGAWNAAWFTSKEGRANDSGLDTGVPHPIQYFPFRRIVLVGSRNKIHTISRPTDTQNDTSTMNRLVFPKELEVRHIFCSSTKAYILCKHLYGGNGKIIEWDGFSETYNQIYDALSPVPLSGVNYNEVPFVLNDRGQILEFTGVGFSPMYRNGLNVALPLIEEPSALVREVSPRGMTVGEDGLIYMNVRHAAGVGEVAIPVAGAAANSYKQESGIWCLNPITGRFYNKHSFGAYDSLGLGAQRNQGAGAIAAVSPASGTSSLLVGGQWMTDLISAGRAGIWVLQAPTDSEANRGHFITQHIPANNVRDFWDSVWVRFKRFATSTNRIVVKAKGVTELKNQYYEALTAVSNWTSTTTFTATLAAGDDAIAVGDEIEVIAGANAGYLAHITTISGNHGAAQTFTIDEAVLVGSGESNIRFDRWKKLATISNTSRYEDSVNIGIKSSFVQFKVEMRGPFRDMEISDLVVNTKLDVHNAK